jgi:hypothetical protein
MEREMVAATLAGAILAGRDISYNADGAEIAVGLYSEIMKALRRMDVATQGGFLPDRR